MRHPHPHVLAEHLRSTAKLLDKHGTKALELVAVLAARGYPRATLGSGSRGSDSTSSTESAALTSTRWAGRDDHHHRLLRSAWKLVLDLGADITDIVAHADDVDPVPAGTGVCARCTKVCRPDLKHPENRIRSGYCPACYQRWRRAGRPDRVAFNRTKDEDAA